MEPSFTLKVEDTDAPDASEGEQGDEEVKKKKSSNLLKAAGVGYEQRRRSQQMQNQAYTLEDNKLVFEGKDGQRTQLEIVEVIEKQGSFRKAVPILPVPIAVIFCVLNVCVPGFGTFLGALSLLCCADCKHESKSTGVKYGFLAGILQILLTPLLFGWIWSMMYGAYMIQESMSKIVKQRQDNADAEGNK